MINQIMNENRKRTIAHNIVSYCVIENAEQYTDRRISVFVFGSDRCLTKSREFWSTTSARTPRRHSKRML